MTRVKRGVWLCLLLGMGAWPSLAHAQGIRLFVMGGGSFLYNTRTFTQLGDEFRSDYASGGRVTIGGEVTPWRIIGIEGAYGYGRNNLRITSRDENQTLGYGVRCQRFSSNLLLHSPVSVLGMRPYATGGLEFDHLAPTDQAKLTAASQGFANQSVLLGANNKIGVNYGGGTDISFFPFLALRLDVRDHITGTPTYGLSSARFPVHGAAHDLEASVGLVFHVGR